MMLPNRCESAAAELALRQFRHEVNSIGDQTTRAHLELLLTRARDLGLRDEEIATELSLISASLDALDLAAQIAQDALPVVDCDERLAPGDFCHFVTPVRFGRRRADQFGHLSLTTGWLKFRGALDLSVAWTEVADVQRAGRDIIVALHDSKRVLRFSCQAVSEAARAGVVAQHLARMAGAPHEEPTTAPCQAAL